MQRCGDLVVGTGDDGVAPVLRCSVNFAGLSFLRPYHNYGYAPSPAIGGIILITLLLTGRLNF
jgi:hypothetical protein